MLTVLVVLPFGVLSAESFTLESKGDPAQIALDHALENSHAATGKKYRCEVANLPRNVTVESADPEGVRGHTMHHRHSAGSVSYARFDHHVYKNLRISQTNSEPFNRGLDDRSEQHGPVTVDGLTFSGLSRSGIPFIQLSDYNVNGEAETHVRNLKIEDRRDGDDDALRRPLVDMGGGARTRDPEISGVPVIVHDLFGAGKHAKFVSSRDVQFTKAKARYREQKPYTGEESRVTDTPEAKFPKLLDPIDDQPPATIITWPKRGLPVKLGKDGTLEVRGTSTDDYEIAGVVVNGVEASDLDYNFTGWSVKLSGLKPGKLKLTALATDKSGNREQTAHVLMITIAE
ncbi:hypothetical protein N9154_02990 [Akkermansiaceae bacterium]|nr:hypothetical protein [Akkermansiaceae bacterium]